MDKVESTIHITAIFNEERTERYLLRKTWQADGKSACIITINPASKDVINLDLTTMLIQNSLNNLGYGSFDAVNISPKINPSSREIGRTASIENLAQIKASAEESQDVIIAWGSAGANNKKINERQLEILSLLKPFQDKVYMITDGKAKNLHPLVPTLRRNKWILEKFQFPALKTEGQDKQDSDKKKNSKKSRKQPVNENKEVGEEQNLAEMERGESEEDGTAEDSEISEIA